MLLLDTHVLLWAGGTSRRLSSDTRQRFFDPANTLAFSIVSIWEIVIKAALGRAHFQVIPEALLAGVRAAGYREVPVNADHALMVGALPLLHRDPFDRLLLAQAMVEGATLITADEMLLRYPGPVELIRPV
ncbi:PIN domain-containing protein [Roseospira navarrensis]|uniref:PIN domain-containing protein n=1 Tax=Roseospira navarrensis TaxID=140058 RepID=A0A7X1ZGG1_9PROT|nr:type II toxin-antitoxin system VapC family toxin [Roseospira navarrensis]MQX37902.1 PIN domain-containing protein [Roseospira navarrensis]